MLAAMFCALAANDVQAQASANPIDIAAHTLRAAVAELAAEAHVSIGAQSRLPDLPTPQVRGARTIDQALDRILSGSPYRAVRVGPTAWRIERVRRQAISPARAAALPAPASAPAPAPATAQDAPPTQIIVTATKTERPLQSLPASVAVVSLTEDDSDLATAGTMRISAMIDGLTLASTGPGRSRMFLRGVVDSPFNGESQSTVANLLDDARITFADPDPDLRLVDIESVEVLKGPQGSLYGTGALGGIYQLRTNQPVQGETSLAVATGAQAVAGGGQGRTGGLGAGGSVIANLPLAHSAAAVRLVGYSFAEAGWINTGQRRNSNATTITGARAMLAIEPADLWRINLTGMAQWINSADSGYVYASGSRSRPDQRPEPHDNDLMLVSLHGAGAIGETHLEFSTAMTWHEVRDSFDATTGAANFGVADPQDLTDDRAFWLWDNEARWNGTFGQIDWMLGAAHLIARQHSLVSLDSSTAPDLAVLDDDRRTTTETALFGQASFPLGSRITLETGGRLFAGTVRDQRLVGGQQLSRDLDRFGFTPSAAIAWQPRASQTLYLRYGSAFRQGGVDIGPQGELEPFDSDELATIELGWRDVSSPVGRLELSTYATRWTGMQADILQDNALIETKNVGEGRILGLEASWSSHVGRNGELSAGASLVDAKLVRNTAGIALDDNRLPVVPRFTLRAGFEQFFAVGRANGGLSIGLNFRGPARLSIDPRLDRPMGNTLESNISGYLLLDGFRFGLEIDNPLCRSDDTFSYGNQLRIFERNQFTPLKPLSIVVSLGYRF